MTVYVSAIFGGYDHPKPAPPGRGILFSDHEISAGGWEVRVTHAYEDLHPRLRAKAIKLQPHVFHPDEPVTTWVDGSMTVHEPANDLEPAGLRFFRHPDRHHILVEAEVSATMSKYARLPVIDQARTYLADGCEPGLWASGFHIRDITAPKVKEFYDCWWLENLLWTYQDQVSLPWARQQTGAEIVDIPGSLWSNPYFSITGHHRDD